MPFLQFSYVLCASYAYIFSVKISAFLLTKGVLKSNTETVMLIKRKRS